LVDLVAKNAAEVLAQMRARWLADERRTSAALVELADSLDLDEPPERIECYDISNIQGASSVASMVVFLDGRPRPQEYRRFRIKTVQGANDFASMAEVLARRFKRFGGRARESASEGEDEPSHTAELEGWGALPDLVIVDGGKGQLSAALDVMRNLGLKHVPLAGLAKQNEELFVQDMAEPILLPRTSQALYLVQRIRDEAHRFAIQYHRKVRGKTGMASALDSVPGVGPKRKRALLRKFGSLSAIRDAPVDEIASTVGFTRSLAEKVKEYL
jgi:excinuclease ABC subunit C